MPYYDKYMMNELNKFTKNVLEEYNNYNFQNVYKLVNNFVSFTLSNFYLDFTKDILYIEKADSLVRRSVQTVLYNILNNEVKLLHQFFHILVKKYIVYFHILKNQYI